MLEIKEIYNDIILLSMNDYYTARYSIFENFFLNFNVVVFDYEITCVDEGYEFIPLSLEESFLNVLKNIHEYVKTVDEQMEVDNLKFDISILCRLK